MGTFYREILSRALQDTPSVVSENWVTVLVSVVIFAWGFINRARGQSAYHNAKTRGEKVSAMASHWRQSAWSGIRIVLWVWCGLFLVSTLKTIYAEHDGLKQQIARQDQLIARLQSQPQQARIDFLTRQNEDLQKQIDRLKPKTEPRNSLRRRTMQLADEMQTYLLARYQNSNQPPFAVPDSSVPNPTDEQKRAIERYRSYQQETWDYYSEHYRDRMIGIIREYQAKGVKTGWLENDANQRPPVIAMPGSVMAGTIQDDLYQFRELAYHVDGEGNLIVITP